jgi:hypothetical protein
LVIVRRLALFLILLHGGCVSALAEEIVRAADYDAYWLWAGVRARPELERARAIYLLQGEIGPDAGGAVRLRAQGAGQPAAHRATLWLAYRVRSLEWPPEIYASILRKLALWRNQPGLVAGIQVDFDSSTHGLSHYADFLRALRGALPKDCALSVTGLMDWASQGSPAALSELSGTVDEVIFQTYRGNKTVPNIDAYLSRLDRLTIPFHLGLAEGASWSAPTNLAGKRNFQGYVVFLRNSP